MAHIRGVHTYPLVSREARPRASSPQDSSEAPQAPTVLSSKGGCHLTLLNVDTRHGDHRLLHPLTHQYTAFHLRESKPQALERRLGMHSLILMPQLILSVLPTLPQKPSSRGLLITTQKVLFYSL
ncbi:hypothetical protein CK203_098136 [Vitis vinifera]|uniref:Uncharacterized protein n=1 Tax=Vitis vinifera TaxID=29760 RepID=A0A438C653_VITVI|nr:hypothetical protein CK203_098136 [Vitis vinifera]